MRSAPFLLMHVACIGVFFVAVNWQALVLCGFLYFIRMFGITAGYHRYFAHRSYKTSRIFQFLMACLGCSAMQKGPFWWAGHHRDHHRYSDTPEDPHSPVVTNFWWSHVGWIVAGDYDETKWEVLRDWKLFPELRWLNVLHWAPGIVLAAGCYFLGVALGVSGWSTLFWGFFVSTVLLYHGTFLVNSLCHVWGKRRYNTGDDSRNNFWVALVTLGEGWHNNHHHYQSSANQGFFWWEIDISYYMIRMLSWVGIVWDVRKPGQKILDAGRRKPVKPKHARREELAGAGVD